MFTGRIVGMMTKEEWEKEQSIVRRVIDPETGRSRFVFLFIYLSVCLSVCISLFISLSVCLYLSLSLSVCQSVCLSLIYCKQTLRALKV